MTKSIQLPAKYKTGIMIACTLVFVIFTAIGYRQGIFTSQARMEQFLGSVGLLAPLLFVFIQAVQVVLPILPGAIGCVYGVVFWGAFKGFLLNYIGICAGSIWAFLLSRKMGQGFVQQATGSKFFGKYSKYLLNEQQFERIFAIMIFLPVAPDDFLCYLAGLSKISLRKFTLIILLGKPLAIFLYSMGLSKVLQGLFSLIG